MQLSKFFIFITFFSFAQTDSILKVNEKCVNFGFCLPDSVRNYDVILIHTSYCVSVNDSFNLNCIIKSYEKYEVAAHYIIDRDGVIHKMVNPEQVAYHGGKGKLPDGNNQINSRSIGIELVNTKYTFLTESQYGSLLNLVNFSMKSNKIKYILGHDDVAPIRKTDPWNFDWKYFKKLLKSDSTLVWRNNKK